MIEVSGLRWPSLIRFRGSDLVMDSDPSAGFPTTHWSRVARAGDPAAVEAHAALSELCAAYWYPIYALIRRLGHSESDALDLTQEYFARLLEKPVLAAADRTKGRFRGFLRADCGLFLLDRRDRDRALKRGGGRRPLSIDARDAEGRYLVEPVEGLTAERLFDRAWALTLLGRALDRLAADYAATGRAPLFERLEPVLVDDSGSVPYSELAAQLGMSLAAIQQAVHRLRRRYREALQAEIAATLEAPTEAAVADEIRDLLEALGR
jgi:RNA polymerase sigma-70 factor (ECF subfamily)